MKENKVWEILEIEPTDDVDAIRDAYRAKLVKTNPEDDQEGFMQLKDAYDKALELASGENTEEEAPYSEVISRVDDIYKDINKRMDTSLWKELFSEPVFTNLDEQDEVRREFLEYTMSHYKYPGEVLYLFDDVFTIRHDRAALCEEFPQDFISFLCDQIENEGDYGLAEKPIIGRANGPESVNSVVVEYNGEPSDPAEFEYEVDEYISTINSFISNYRRIENLKNPEDYRAAELESLGESILQAKKYDFYHPFEDIAVIRYLYYKERYDECFSLLSERIEHTLMAGEEHSDFYYSHLIFMYLRFFIQDIHKDMGLEISDEVLDKAYAALPKTMNLVYVNETHPAMGLYWYLKGDKKRANEYILFTFENVESTAYKDISDQIDRERREELPAMIEAEPDNLSYKISLGWLYARAERMEDAYKILEGVSEKDRSDMEYYAIMGRLLLTENKIEESLPYLIKWNELLVESYGYDKNLDKNALPIEEVRQIIRVPYSYYLIAVAQVNLGDMDNAKSNVLLALKGASLKEYYEFTDLYNYIINSIGAFEEGLEFWSREVEKENDYITIAHGGRQYMAYKAGDVNTVIDDYFYLRNNDPMYVDSYVFAEEIFLDYDDMESFEVALQYVEHAGVQDVKLDINKAKYLYEKDDYEGAEALFKQTLENYPEDANVNYEYGRILDRLDRRDEAAEQYEKGLEKNPEHQDILYQLSEYYNDYRFEVLEDESSYQKGLDCSEKLIGLSYSPKTAVNHALILMAGMRYEEALEFSKKMVEDYPDDPYANNALGRAYMYMEMYEDAEKSFKDAIACYKGTRSFISYKNLVRVYRMMQRFRDAVDIYKEYIERFELDDITTFTDFADTYDDAEMYEEALACRHEIIVKKLRKITGKDIDFSEEISMKKAVADNPDIPIENFGDLLFYIRKYATTLSYMNRLEDMKAIEKDMNEYLELADAYKSVEDMTENFREMMRYALHAAAYYYTFVRRSPEDAIKNFKQFSEVRIKTEGEEKDYYEDLYEAYDLISRNYLLMGDTEQAVIYADKSLESLKEAFGSEEKYLNYARYTPLRACRLSGLYLIKEGKEAALRYLDMIDSCKKCEHCGFSVCVDKLERLGYLAEVDGDYGKAIEYYEEAIRYGGNDSERTSAIRECRSK